MRKYYHLTAAGRERLRQYVEELTELERIIHIIAKGAGDHGEQAFDRVLERIRAGLDGLPEDTVRRALDYYQEYIAEAIEAGRSEDEILLRLR